MRWDPYDPEDEYVPDEETGTCSHCGEHCTVIGVDDGIGPYEFWGQKGRHVDIVQVSNCCEAKVN
jgi:hypothetical protein